jgi:cobyrinic acid a,c-diamide synthase
MKRGQGISGKNDGICYKNVLATYTHLHAYGAPEWAAGLVRQALLYRQERSKDVTKKGNRPAARRK